MKENFVPRGELLTTEKKKRQMISDILDTDYTELHCCFYILQQCNPCLKYINNGKEMR